VGVRALADDGRRLAEFTNEALPLLDGDHRNELMFLLLKHGVAGAAAYMDKIVVHLDTNELRCKNCGQPYYHNETTCEQCGQEDVTRNIDSHSLPPPFSHKGVPSGITPEAPKTGYVRRPFFIDHLNRLTGRIKREIPDDVYTLVYTEAKKRNYTQLNRQQVRNILAACRRADMYDCDIFIAFQFNGVPPPEFSGDQLNTLISMFEDVEDAFAKCPMEIKRRDSMIGYYYLIYKFCHLLSWDEYLPYIQMPKKPTYQMYDRIWQWICLNRTKEPLWTYYKTELVED
jgi:hypothetical protein